MQGYCCHSLCVKVFICPSREDIWLVVIIVITFGRQLMRNLVDSRHLGLLCIGRLYAQMCKNASLNPFEN